MSVNAAVAAKVFIIKDERLLLVKRSNDNVQKPGIWEVPGGRLEPGENPYEGAKRVVIEEVGMEIEPKYCFNVRHFTRAPC
jgi:8-oxo-dGTP diphosphatase